MPAKGPSEINTPYSLAKFLERIIDNVITLLRFSFVQKRDIAKGKSAGKAENTYTGQVSILPGASNARNFTQCDSLLIGDECGAHTVPYIEVRNPTAQMGHEATTSKVNDDQLFYLQQRGIDLEEANYMVINGFCRGIFKELPFEFAMEASQLLRVSLEGTVG